MDFEKLSKIKHKEIERDTIIHYPEIEAFCGLPYPNHPHGCPNKNKCGKIDVPRFDIILKHGHFKRFYLIYIKFDFKQYKELRKQENPEFYNTKGRLRCNLYYQNSLKKAIQEYIEDLRKINGSFYVLGFGSGLKLSFQNPVASMEKVCINVFSTMKLNGIKFEIKPVNKIIFCNLLCSKQELSFKKKVQIKLI